MKTVSLQMDCCGVEFIRVVSVSLVSLGGIVSLISLESLFPPSAERSTLWLHEPSRRSR